MQEELKKVTSITAEPEEKTVTLCIRSQRISLSGIWNWDMQSPAIYCSDVMSFPDEFIGTKGIIHPDDLPKLMGAITLMEEKEIPRLDFRIITTYGDVKIITGKRVGMEASKDLSIDLLPGKEPWEEALQLLSARRENDLLQLRKELAEYTERLSAVGSWMISRETGQSWYSDNVFRIHGIAPQSLNSHANTFHPFIHKDDRLAVLEAFDKAFSELVPIHIEYRIVLSDGEVRTVQQITRWMYNAKGESLFTGIFRDITEERAFADKLLNAQSHTLLHQQLLKFSEQQVMTGYWFMDLDTRKTSYSDNYYRIYGFKQAILPNYNSFLNLVHSDDRDKLRDLIEKMYSEHTLPETDYRIVRPDGKIRHLRQSGRLFISPNKNLMMIGVVQDLSVQKGLEKKIADLTEQITLNNAVMEMADSITETSFFVWLTDGCMQWSDDFYRMLGYRAGSVEPLQRFLYKNIHPNDLKIFRDAETLLLNNQQHDDIVIHLVSKTGVRKVRISFRQINYGKNATIALVHDVTHRTKFDEQFRDNKLFTQLLEESVNDMVIYTNIDHTILHWNTVAVEKTGIQKEEALYNNLFDVLTRLREEDFLSKMHLAINGTEVSAKRVNNFYLRQSHDYHLWPLKTENGEVLGVLHVVQDISKQLVLQQQLSERLNFIESLVESSVDRIVVLDRFMNYLYWNRRAEEYSGIQKEKVIGKNILEIFPLFRNDPGYGEFRKVLRGETVYLPATVSEDTNEYAETYLTPIKNEEGTVTAILWIVHDLKGELQLQQEREAATKKIKEQAHYLQRITETVPDMLSITELETGKFQFLNPETFTAHGFSAQEMLNSPGKVNAELIHTDDRKILEQYFKGFVNASDGYIGSVEYRAKTKQGEWKWFLVRGKIFQRDATGRVTHVLNAIENITIKKNSEQQLRENKDLLQNIIDAPHIGLAVYKAIRNAEGEIVDFVHQYINRASLKMLGGEDFTGRLFTDHGENAIVQMPQFIEVIQSGKANEYTREALLRGQNFWFAITNTPLGEDRLLHTWEDITERKVAEQELLRLKDELAQKANDKYESLFNSIERILHHRGFF